MGVLVPTTCTVPFKVLSTSTKYQRWNVGWTHWVSLLSTFHKNVGKYDLRQCAAAPRYLVVVLTIFIRPIPYGEVPYRYRTNVGTILRTCVSPQSAIVKILPTGNVYKVPVVTARWPFRARRRGGRGGTSEAPGLGAHACVLHTPDIVLSTNVSWYDLTGGTVP